MTTGTLAVQAEAAALLRDASAIMSVFEKAFSAWSNQRIEPEMLQGACQATLSIVQQALAQFDDLSDGSKVNTLAANRAAGLLAVMETGFFMCTVGGGDSGRMDGVTVWRCVCVVKSLLDQATVDIDTPPARVRLVGVRRGK
jgi:hypothetical protein